MIPDLRVAEELRDLDQQAPDQALVFGGVTLDEGRVVGDGPVARRVDPAAQPAHDGGRLVRVEVDRAAFPDPIEESMKGLVLVFGNAVTRLDEADHDLRDGIEVGPRIDQRRRDGRGHRGEHGRLGVLDDDGAAGLLDVPCPGRAVGPGPGQDHGRQPLAVDLARRS